MAERSGEEIQRALDKAYRRQDMWRAFWFLLGLAALIALFWWI